MELLDLKEFNELYQKHEEKLIKNEIFKKAINSVIYRDNWKNKNIDSNSLKGFKGLKELPYASAEDLRSAWEKYPIEEIILTKNVGIWHCTSGSMGTKKWLPWTYTDYSTGREEAAKIFFATGMKPDDIMMSIVLPAPYISGSLGYRMLEGSGSIGTPIEQIIMAPDFVKDSFSLLLKRQPTLLLCTPSLALRMAEIISKNTPLILSRLAKEKNSMKLKLASFITKIKSIKPKQIFKNLKAGYFTAEPLDPYRRAVEDQYGIEAFDIYGFTEGFGAGFECSAHNGLHFPSLNVILEIIPKSELEKEKEDTDYIPQAILLNEVEKGLEGELVATDFKEAFPLVRYRLRDMVRVVDTDICSCGYKSPKLKILGRTDDIINLGVIRISTMTINDILYKKYENGTIKKWEIYISREGYKPKLTLNIEVESIGNEEKFKQEIYSNLYALDVFRQGVDNELFIFDKINFISNLNLEIIGQGKTRKIRYSNDYMNSVKF